MTETIATRTTALVAALLLVLGMAALAVVSPGELDVVRAASETQPAPAQPNGTGEACPEASPQGAEADPACGEEGQGKKGNQGNDAEKGNQGQGDTGEACPESSPNAGGPPPCGDGEDEGLTEDEQCEADGGEWDAEAGECDLDEELSEQEQCEADGGEWDAEAGECDLDNGVNAEACDAPDGIGLTDDGTLAKTLHLNDPTGLSSNPAANGPLSGELYAGGRDTPVQPLTDEAACALSLTGAL